MDQLVVSVKDAAKLLNLGRSTIRDLLKAGKLPHKRVGRRILIPRKAVERFVEEGVNGNAR
jgi:excisionase family DNA binding protein